jgi:hypothetical protein
MFLTEKECVYCKVRILNLGNILMNLSFKGLILLGFYNRNYFLRLHFNVTNMLIVLDLSLFVI